MKKLLYVLRTSITGVHLLETGEMQTDLRLLMDRYDVPDAAILIDRKRAGERVALDPSVLESWRARIDRLFSRLDAARERSPLPAEPANEEDVRRWLVALRRARFA